MITSKNLAIITISCGANMTATAADVSWKVSATEKTVSGRTWRPTDSDSQLKEFSVAFLFCRSRTTASGQLGRQRRPFVGRFKGQWTSPKADRYLAIWMIASESKIRQGLGLLPTRSTLIFSSKPGNRR